MQSPLLHSGFLRSSEFRRHRPALEIGEQTLTYGNLRERAASLAATLQLRAPLGGSAMTAVFADRSVTTFTGILGSLMAGHAYVPLNPHFPPVRTRWMLQQAECRSLIVDAASEKQLSAKIEAFRSQKEVIKAQYSAAEAQVRIGEAATGIGEQMADTGLAIQRAKDKTDQMQARAGAMDELMASGTLEDFTAGDQSQLDRELAQLASQSQVDQELAKMKAELGAGSDEPKKELEQ